MTTRSKNLGERPEHRLLSLSSALFFSEFSWGYEKSSLRSGFVYLSLVAPVLFSGFLCCRFRDSDVEIYDDG